MKSDFHTFMAPIAVGELVDKVTILRIKRVRLNQHEALSNVITELGALEDIMNDADHILKSQSMLTLIDKLLNINTQLWEVEDQLRVLEAEESFGQEFIELARLVYKLNDKRASIKRDINIFSGSTLVEEKSYGQALP